MGSMCRRRKPRLPAVGRTDKERRVLINLIGPTWEGNQVWLVLGGGAIFAAWPTLYAVSFSGFCIAMIAILLALILRPVGFKFCGKVQIRKWQSVWDWGLFVGGFVPAVVSGVAVGNVLLGAPFGLDESMRASYAGNFFGLFTPFAILAGLVSLSMLLTQGASYIAMRTQGVTAERARTYERWAALATIALFVLGGVMVLLVMEGYRITSIQNLAGPSNPLGKTVVIERGGWTANYGTYPWMTVAPILAIARSLTAFFAFGTRNKLTAFIGSSLAIFGIISTAGLSLFPFLLPSSRDPSMSLTVWDSSSSQLTLFIMLVATLLFLPIVLFYTSWVFRIIRGPVDVESFGRNPNPY